MNTQLSQTSLIKKYILQRFGVKVSIRTEWFSCGNSMHVSYSLGCHAGAIETFIKRLEEGHFDGMNDIYEYYDKAETGMRLNGIELNTFNYVLVDREIPDSVRYRLAQAVSDKMNFEDVHKCKSFEDFNRSFKRLFFDSWNWNGLMYRFAKDVNFVTQDETKIKDVVMEDFDSYKGCNFSYTVDGIRYETKNLELRKSEVKKSSQAERNDIKMVNYSDRALAIYGNTYEIKNQLKELGAKFNRNLRDGAGWIVPKSYESQISDIIIDYHNNTK